MVAVGTNALASSIVLVCRPRPDGASITTRKDFLVALGRELPSAVRTLQQGNIAPVDLQQACIGPGMAVFSRYQKVLETDGTPMKVHTALALINQTLDEALSEQESDFDPDTRFALAWFEQFQFGEGKYGQAEVLATAKAISVSGLAAGGIAYVRAGNVRLLKRSELRDDWDPSGDDRLTVWEATQYLIRALDSGIDKAADLAARLGGLAETARELAYRLYTICERKNWADEAQAYNGLVVNWPDIRKQAEEFMLRLELDPADLDVVAGLEARVLQSADHADSAQPSLQVGERILVIEVVARQQPLDPGPGHREARLPRSRDLETAIGGGPEHGVLGEPFELLGGSRGTGRERVFAAARAAAPTSAARSPAARARGASPRM